MAKYGYINTKGEFLVEPRFRKASSFNGGYARAELFSKDAPSRVETGCSVDRQGKITPIKNLCSYTHFSEGLAVFIEPGSGNKRGFTDAQGNVVVPAAYCYSNNFQSGRVIVSAPKLGVEESQHTRDYEFVLIDNRGRELRRIGITGSIVCDWSDGLAVCRPELQEDNRYCYVDHDGEIIVRTPNDGVSYDFNDGLASFSQRTKGGYEYGFFDKSGKVVIPLQYEFATGFSDGLAAVWHDDRWFYIDLNGEKVFTLPEDCSRAYGFNKGLAAVMLGGEKVEDESGDVEVKGAKLGYVDRQGNVIIQPRFGHFWDSPQFGEEGLASVCELSDGALVYGYIDTTGKYVIKPTFTKATRFSSGFAAVQLGTIGFDAEEWKSWCDSESQHANRFEALAKFFRAYPVLGMNRSEIHTLLGQGEKREYDTVAGLVESYGINASWCGNASSNFELLYEDDRVAGWRSASMGHKPPFKTERSDLIE